MNEKSIIAQELGRRGGKKTFDIHGKDHYIKMLKKRHPNSKKLNPDVVPVDKLPE